MSTASSHRRSWLSITFTALVSMALMAFVAGCGSRNSDAQPTPTAVPTTAAAVPTEEPTAEPEATEPEATEASAESEAAAEPEATEPEATEAAAEPEATAVPAESTAGDVETMLANATYPSEFTQDGTAPLVDGVYSEQAAPDSAISTTVTLLPEYTALGELDGQPAAAVILATDPGGSGTFVDLGVVTIGDGKPVTVATTQLGDRVEINSLVIENNQIIVDMLTQGPDDPMCCPSQEVVQTYELQDGELVLVDTQEIETPSESATPAAETSTGGDVETIVANATFPSEFTQDGTATLVDGAFAEPAAPGSAISTTVTLMPQYTAVGELDGQPAAAVILATNPGGSGTFIDLGVVSIADGEAVTVTTTQLGDRVEINSVTIENNQIVVDMLTQGPNDPMCCPSQEVQQTYELQDGELVLVDTQELGTSTEAADPDPVTTDTDVPAVDLPQAAEGAATGVIVAEEGVNVRTGPGTDYPIIGIAPPGTEGEIVGVSADGRWWVAAVAQGPDGQGWVSTAYVEATNADDVPVIPAPPLP
ncbi:MAG: SH3 domain-containing protein [Caldilineaceae bacterium]